MVSAQTPLAAVVQPLVAGVSRTLDMVGTPVRVKSVVEPLELELLVEPLL
jgi:hypothetical protein